MRISVIGGGRVSDDVIEIAETLGRELAERNHTLICGGLTGVMEGVCKGVANANGKSIGILPGTDPHSANEYVTTVIPTGLGHARNILVVMNGDGVIAVNGSGGTLSEIGFAFVMEKPIAGLNTFDVPGITPVETPRDAIQHIEQHATPIFP